MKKFLCGFYAETLNWTVYASNRKQVAARFAEYIKANGITSTSGINEFVVLEIK